MNRSRTTCLQRRFIGIAFAFFSSAALVGCGGGASQDSGSDALAASADARAQAVSVPVQETTSSIVVSARGSLLDGHGPQVQLWVNRQLIGSVEVASTAFKDYVFAAPFVQAGSQVDVVFTNDAVSLTGDRNLWVRTVTVDGVAYGSTSSDAVIDVGSGAAAFDGVDLRAGQEGIYWNASLRVTAAGAPTGEGYYLDVNSGRDDGPGTMAMPWKTLARLKSVALSKGQGIFLRCGQIWRESLVLGATQLADGVHLSGYGSDCAQVRPVITGADSFSQGWSKAGNVWSRPVPSGTPLITRLFVNGISQAVARWPNKTATSAGYAYVAAQSSPSKSTLLASVADRAALQGRDLKGAAIHIRTMPWRIESFSVSSYDGNQGLIYLDGSGDYEIDPLEGYLFEGKLWMLDAPGEFFHDVASSRIYLYPSDVAAQADLNTAIVEGNVRDDVVVLSGRASLRIENVAIRGGRNNGLVLRDVPGAVVEGVAVSGNGGAGAYLVQNPSLAGPAIRTSVFDDNWLYGIDAQYAGAAQIIANDVTRTGTLTTPRQSYAGISSGPGSKVQDNVIDGSAYHGIRFSGTGGSVTSGNMLMGYCQRLSDCGGIYTWNGSKASGASQAAIVERNQLLEAVASVDGAVGPGADLVAGIFLDDYTNGVTARGNTAFRVPVGLMVHNSFNNLIEANGFLLNTKTGIHASMDRSDRDWMTGNSFRDNEIIPARSAVADASGLPVLNEVYPIWFFHALTGSASITSASNTFSGNRVSRLDGSLHGIHTWIRSNVEDIKLSSAAWARFNPGDAATTAQLVASPYVLSLGPELVPGGDFYSGLGGWKNYFKTGGAGGNVVNSSGIIGCTGICVTMTAGSTDDYISSPAFSMRSGALHSYSYSAVLGGAATLGWPYISRTTSPWDSVAQGAGFSSSTNRSGVSGQVINYQGFFTPKTSDPARVNLQLKSIGIPVSFDNVSVREVSNIAYGKISDWAALPFASARGAVTVTCASLGWADTCRAMKPDGTAVALPMVLAAGTSQLLFRIDSPWIH